MQRRRSTGRSTAVRYQTRIRAPAVPEPDTHSRAFRAASRARPRSGTTSRRGGSPVCPASRRRVTERRATAEWARPWSSALRAVPGRRRMGLECRGKADSVPRAERALRRPSAPMALRVPWEHRATAHRGPRLSGRRAMARWVPRPAPSVHPVMTWPARPATAPWAHRAKARPWSARSEHRERMSRVHRARAPSAPLARRATEPPVHRATVRSVRLRKMPSARRVMAPSGHSRRVRPARRATAPSERPRRVPKARPATAP